MTTTLCPEDAIRQMYDNATLHEIALHGCESGAAFNHVTHEDTIAFYKQHHYAVNDFLEENLHETVEELCADCENEQDAMVHLCWMFIEVLATMYEVN